MIFLTKKDVLKIHRRTIDEHGGISGIRDESALQSAVFAPENRFYYENSDVFDCAAAYAFHLSKAHAFIDGNKRVAAVSAEVFLLINGFAIIADEKDLEDLYLGIAEGIFDRKKIGEFFRASSAPLV